MKRNWRSHYITLVANLIVVIATAINFAVFALRDTTTIYAILIAPFLAVVFSCLLYYFDIKYFFNDYPYKKFHFKKKWTKFYIVGICIFGIELLAILIFVIVGSYNYINVINLPESIQRKDMIIEAANLLAYLLWASFGVACVLGLVATGFIKYSRFKIDVEILARKNGKNVNDELNNTGKSVVDDKAVIISFDESNNKNLPKSDSESDKKPETPSAGLSSI